MKYEASTQERNDLFPMSFSEMKMKETNRDNRAPKESVTQSFGEWSSGGNLRAKHRFFQYLGCNSLVKWYSTM